jgi:hypothetical protein
MIYMQLSIFFNVFGVFDLATMVTREEPQHNNTNKTLGEKKIENDIFLKLNIL